MWKVLLKKFHLNGVRHKIYFPQPQKLEPPYKTLSFSLGLKKG